MPDVDELTRELDLDAALARTYELHDGLRRTATARRRWATGGGLLAAAAIAAALIIPAIGSGGSQPTKVPAPADGPAATTTTTTTTASDGGVPAGYSLSTEGDVFVLRRDDVPATTTTSPGAAAVGIGDAVAVERGTIASGSISADGRTAVVGFACVAGNQELDTVRFRPEPARIVVDAEVSIDPGSAPCSSSSPEMVIQLPLPAAVAPGTAIVAEPLHTP